MIYEGNMANVSLLMFRRGEVPAWTELAFRSMSICAYISTDVRSPRLPSQLLAFYCSYSSRYPLIMEAAGWERKEHSA